MCITKNSLVKIESPEPDLTFWCVCTSFAKKYCSLTFIFIISILSVLCCFFVCLVLWQVFWWNLILYYTIEYYTEDKNHLFIKKDIESLDPFMETFVFFQQTMETVDFYFYFFPCWSVLAVRQSQNTIYFYFS